MPMGEPRLEGSRGRWRKKWPWPWPWPQGGARPSEECVACVQSAGLWDPQGQSAETTALPLLASCRHVRGHAWSQSGLHGGVGGVEGGPAGRCEGGAHTAGHVPGRQTRGTRAGWPATGRGSLGWAAWALQDRAFHVGSSGVPEGPALSRAAGWAAAGQALIPARDHPALPSVAAPRPPARRGGVRATSRGRSLWLRCVFVRTRRPSRWSLLKRPFDSCPFHWVVHFLVVDDGELFVPPKRESFVSRGLRCESAHCPGFAEIRPIRNLRVLFFGPA